MLNGAWMKFGGAAIMVAALGFAAATMAMGGSAKRGKAPNIYYRTQAAADAALAAYPGNNPECVSWTNWQKTCSWLGKKRGVECKTDPKRKARPSTPFCIGGRSADPFDKLQTASRMRYCSKVMHIGDGELKGEPYCDDHADDRPFNGQSIAMLRGPMCEVWGRDDKAVCSESGQFPELPRCDTVNDRKTGKGQYYCAHFNKKTLDDFGCELARVSAYQGRRYPYTIKTGEIILKSVGKAETGVVSIFCDY